MTRILSDFRHFYLIFKLNKKNVKNIRRRINGSVVSYHKKLLLTNTVLSPCYLIINTSSNQHFSTNIKHYIINSPIILKLRHVSHQNLFKLFPAFNTLSRKGHARYWLNVFIRRVPRLTDHVLYPSRSSQWVI